VLREGQSGHVAAKLPEASTLPRRTQCARQSPGARALAKSTRFGRKEQEAQWKNAEVDALYKLLAAGVRVPKPCGYFNGTLIMELMTDVAGYRAPRLGEVDLSAETARQYHRFLIEQIVRMLSIGLIHGDLFANRLARSLIAGSERELRANAPPATTNGRTWPPRTWPSYQAMLVEVHPRFSGHRLLGPYEYPRTR